LRNREDPRTRSASWSRRPTVYLGAQSLDQMLYRRGSLKARRSTRPPLDASAGYLCERGPKRSGCRPRASR